MFLKKDSSFQNVTDAGSVIPPVERLFKGPLGSQSPSVYEDSDSMKPCEIRGVEIIPPARNESKGIGQEASESS